MARRGVFDLIMNKEEYMEPEQTAVPIKLADSNTQDPDEMVECPYDKVHMIRVSRFPMHLLKCRKNYAGKEMFTCPFNARHLVPKPEARHHVANCPDKAAIEKDMVQGYESNNTYCRGYIKVPSYCSNNEYEHPPTENWDEEISRTREDQEREYWGPDGRNGSESTSHALPRPRGRGAPRAMGHSNPPPSASRQPEMRLPRQPAQAAALAQQRHQQIQLQLSQEPLPQQPPRRTEGAATTTQLPQGPPQIKVAGLGRGQPKGRVMAANLWSQGQGQGQGQMAPNGQPSQPRPGGLGQSSWADQNGDMSGSYVDDFPSLGESAGNARAAPLGLGRGLGRGSILANPPPPAGLQNRP